MKKNPVPFMQIRGGSSKGIYFLKEDLPQDIKRRDEVILDIVGRDKRQIDALGGANPLTSKVAIVSQSLQENAHVDFLFVQVVVGENRVDTTPNCGNILAGVGIFALESGLVEVTNEQTTVIVNMLNSDTLCELILETPQGKVAIKGSTKIDGVPGMSAPIICNYLDTQGAICGSLFPTGNQKDKVNGVWVTCIDNGMPVVLIDAKSMGKSGYECCEALENDLDFREKLEKIRLKTGAMMGLGDVSKKVIPKMTLISKAQHGGTLNTRTFIPHNCHAAIGVLGAVSVASAALFKQSVAGEIVDFKEELPQNIVVEHPSGNFHVNLESERIESKINIKKAGIIRTARLLAKGFAYLPELKGE